ncbi:hypothetical protein HAX54_052117 [Datura stramonium]|uniref:Zinc finger CCCH domain-containing protein 44 n=1 Tax=Datura stramonium TaxID=4076 RepID=A0ABS8RRI1_DATST|nr:hypothetical protein [Datura stramonium]
MDGGNSSSGMYPPCLQVHSQRLDEGTATSTGLQSSEQCSSVHSMNDSQLVGVPSSVPGGSPSTVAVDVRTSAANLIAGVDRRKRGRPPRNQTVKHPPPKKPREEDEDVCFICFDGGSLVLCDRKGCPKAYHPACIKRDEAFFRSKAKWNCGWHICSVCQKASHYLCYTCTYSLCKACTKNADYLCVRGNKGFCSTCMKTIMLIENKDQANKEMVQVDFDDKTSWEYLFKVYWVILKEKLSLTLDELVQAKNPCKESDALHGKRPLLPYGHYVAKDGKGIAGKSFDHLELLELSKKDPPTTESRTTAESNNPGIFSSTPQLELTKPAEELELQNEDCLRTKQGSTAVQTSVNGCMEWASKELLDFVAHMKDGDTSAISQFDVQTLLLNYIKKNNLRDPRRKSQIICDSRLRSLFGKPRVGHIEMLKLLEFHFLIKEDSEKSAFIPAGIVGTVTDHVEPDDSNNVSSSKKRKSRKNGEVKLTQINLDEYAAIDAHNINFLYLRRDLMENLAEDAEKFHDRVIGSVVRIRIPGNDQKQEIYRLVHVVGTCKSSEPYKIRDKTVDVLLEVLNLDKKEAISIDSISNQDFCEDECRRLRQIIKCGLVKRLTVGEIQKKAMKLRAVKLNDSLEAEILRLNHLRDRASEKGHKKEYPLSRQYISTLRECIEKLELLKTPEERHRRLLEIPEVHADPKMNPDYESEGDDGEHNDKIKVEYPAPRCTRISRTDEKLISSGSLVKEEGSVLARGRMSEQREACGTNILDKQRNQLTVEQAVDRFGSETSMASLSTANSSSVNGSETDKLWHYRDPAKRIQGPFSVTQLRKWNTSGLFPPDMRIWTNHEHEDSVLLTNALKGLFHKESQVHDKTSSQSREPAGLDSRTSVRWSESATGSGGECGKREAPGHLHNANYCSNGNTEFTRMNGLSPSFPQWAESLKGNNSCADKPQLLSSPSSSQREVILALPRQEKGHENDNYRSVADHGTQNLCKSTLCHSQSNSRNLGPSSGQNQGSFTSIKCSINLDSASSFASATKSSDPFQQREKVNLPDLPSPTPETSYGDLEAQAAEKLLLLSSVIPVCGSDIHDLPSPTPISNSEAQGGHAAENKESGPSSLPDSEAQGGNATENKVPDSEAQGGHAAENKGSGPSSLPVQESGQRWSSASSPAVGGPQLREIADEWGRSSPAAKPSTEEWDSGLVSVSSLKPADTVGDHVATPTSNADQLTAKPSTEEWDSGLVSVSSLKPAEGVGDHVATPTSNADQLNHTSPSHPMSNFFGEPIEFSTLAEESVSDLLAEVDAMESQNQNGMGSPTSAMRCGEEMIPGCKTDCFSPIEELSPTHNPVRSDALSSTGDLQLPCQSTVTDETVGASRADAFDPLRRSGGNSSTSSEGETKSADVLFSQGDIGSDIPAPCTTSQSTAFSSMGRSTAFEGMTSGRGAAPGNPSWGGPVQGYANVGFGSSMGAAWGNSHMNRGAPYTGNPVWDSQRRYGGERSGGPRDWALQGGESGFGRGRSCWNRQQPYGGGGYSRPPPKGQRICKFYESGRCKKGAACDYLHP